MSEKIKVLVVEDDTAVAMMMTHVLSQAGFDVEPTTNGRRGLELATTQKFDLILSDVDLGVPKLTGFDICRELKQRHISYRTPIILLSGNGTEERRAKALDLGAADFIEKPFRASDFISRIMTLVEESTLA